MIMLAAEKVNSQLFQENVFLNRSLPEALDRYLN